MLFSPEAFIQLTVYFLKLSPCMPQKTDEKKKSIHKYLISIKGREYWDFVGWPMGRAVSLLVNTSSEKSRQEYHDL